MFEQVSDSTEYVAILSKSHLAKNLENKFSIKMFSKYSLIVAQVPRQPFLDLFSNGFVSTIFDYNQYSCLRSSTSMH